MLWAVWSGLIPACASARPARPTSTPFASHTNRATPPTTGMPVIETPFGGRDAGG